VDSHLPLSSYLRWIPSALHPLLRTALIRSLLLGPRPQHVAFIMDGNRRHARNKHQPVRVGHEEGFEALKRVLSFFLKLEIPHVTLYAFSIENFNRDPNEVDALMDMARLRLVEICEKGSVFLSKGVGQVEGRRAVDEAMRGICSQLATGHSLGAQLTEFGVTGPCSIAMAFRSESSDDVICSRPTSRKRAPKPRP